MLTLSLVIFTLTLAAAESAKSGRLKSATKPAQAASASQNTKKSRWPTPPAWWRTQAACIRSHEGAYTTLNPPYAGAYQFMLGTWNANGGQARTLADIARAAPAEQDYRAWLNWLRNGRMWGRGQWPTSSRLCGLR